LSSLLHRFVEEKTRTEFRKKICPAFPFGDTANDFTLITIKPLFTEVQFVPLSVERKRRH